VEWPTLFVAVLVHGLWLCLTFYHAAVPWPLLAILGGGVIAWHGSLQHEVIHGHPTGLRWLDTAIGSAPLSLWLPYPAYRRSHIAHHASAHITDPFDDPESHYLARDGGLRGLSARLESTLVLRLLLGPPIRVTRFLGAELAQARRDPRQALRDWAVHGATLLPLLWWLDRIGLSLGGYVFAFVYPGIALSLLRSFAEHRADRDPARRAAIIERPGPFGLLFLNNNLHAAHHARPDLPWYRLPGYFRDNRHAFLAAPHYQGYGEVVRRFAWKPQDAILHPDHALPE